MITKFLDCKINEKVWFSRKTYFYPDLPKNFQITQYESPLGTDGHFTLNDQSHRHLAGASGGGPGRIKRVGRSGEEVSFIDYNRSGIPLVEIVSAPDLRSPDEAREFIDHAGHRAQASGGPIGPGRADRAGGRQHLGGRGKGGGQERPRAAEPGAGAEATRRTARRRCSRRARRWCGRPVVTTRSERSPCRPGRRSSRRITATSASRTWESSPSGRWRGNWYTRDAV